MSANSLCGDNHMHPDREVQINMAPGSHSRSCSLKVQAIRL